MNSYSSKRQKAQKKKRVRRKKEPTSAAQKILIIFCLSALLILVSLIIRVVSFDNELQNNDESSSLSIPTTAVTTSTAVQTAVTSSSASTVSTTLTTTTETTAATTVTTVNSRYKYRTSFSMALPDTYSGEYYIEIICNDTGKIFTVPDIVIPDMTSVSQEIYYLTPDDSVSADVYLINTANSKRALIGTAMLDFGSSSADYSELDAESAFNAVQ